MFTNRLVVVVKAEPLTDTRTPSPAAQPCAKAKHLEAGVQLALGAPVPVDEKGVTGVCVTSAAIGKEPKIFPDVH